MKDFLGVRKQDDCLQKNGYVRFVFWLLCHNFRTAFLTSQRQNLFVPWESSAGRLLCLPRFHSRCQRSHLCCWQLLVLSAAVMWFF